MKELVSTMPSRSPIPTLDEAEQMAKLKVDHFKQALKSDPDAAAELPDRSYHRYITGDFPTIVRWLMRYPTLLLALEKDARVNVRDLRADVAPSKVQEARRRKAS
jgi:hypothetical protein